MIQNSVLINFLDNTFMVDLNKGPSGLGFSVYGGVDVDTGDQSQGVVRIKKVFPLGPAKSSQQIQRDDVLLEVNGVPVKGRTHAVSSQISLRSRLDSS